MWRRTMKFKVTIIVCVLALLGGFCPVDRSLAAEPYHLGVNLAITGTGALYCKDGVDAIELAVKEINDQGGFLGKHPIKLLYVIPIPNRTSLCARPRI